MATARISVNVDEEVKLNAQKILSEIGMDLTTAIDLLLRTIVREERIPFELRTQKSYKEEIYRNYVLEELAKSKAEAANPNTKWISHDDVITSLQKQRKARNSVRA